jgi:hypothetical protein
VWFRITSRHHPASPSPPRGGWRGWGNGRAVRGPPGGCGNPQEP